MTQSGRLLLRHSEGRFARLARYATDWSGSTMAFDLAVAVIGTWPLTGPLFGFLDTWQLVITKKASRVSNGVA